MSQMIEYLGIPIYALVAAGATILALIAFAITFPVDKGKGNIHIRQDGCLTLAKVFYKVSPDLSKPQIQS